MKNERFTISNKRIRQDNHKRYYYPILYILSILIFGMLCNLQTISNIYEWCKEDICMDLSDICLIGKCFRTVIKLDWHD